MGYGDYEHVIFEGEEFAIEYKIVKRTSSSNDRTKWNNVKVFILADAVLDYLIR
jgi:predicted NAD-dependent protein-ADP-ribosyltransferase YbiA (DUF1768 family)